MAKRWTPEEEFAALGYIRGAHSTPPADRTPGALRQKFPDEMSFLVVESWARVPAATRHHLTLSVARSGLTESVALGEKTTAQNLIDRFTHQILPEAILRKDRYPEGEWAAEVRRALFAVARTRLSA